MKVFQIGAAGGIGRPLAARLVQRGDQVVGMHRKTDQADTVSATGALPVLGDLISDSVDELADKMTGSDAVVFSAGAHGTGVDQTTLIDGKGLEKAADAAAQVGVSRFILVSVFPEAGRAKGRGEPFEHYMRVKKTADVELVRSALDWVIVRPGTLTDHTGDDKVTAGLAIEYGEVKRENVAAFIEKALYTPELNRVIVELTDGPTPVDEAVTQLT